MPEFNNLQYLTTNAGDKLPFRTATAPAEAQGIVLLSHGIAEHSLRYRHLAEQLSAAGFHVFIHDHRGHGANISGKIPLGTASGQSQNLLNDIALLHKEAVARHSGLPVFIIGHSTGASIALNHAQLSAPKPAGIAIISPYIPQKTELKFLKLLIKAERFRKGSDVPSLLMRKMTTQRWVSNLQNPRTEQDWLCSDAQIVETYIQDPLCGFCPSTGMWLDILDITEKSMKSSSLSQLPPDLPLYLAGGALDNVTVRSKNLGLFARRLIRKDFKQVSLQIWPRMRHDIFNEADNKKVADHLIFWLDKQANDYQLLDMP